MYILTYQLTEAPYDTLLQPIRIRYLEPQVYLCVYCKLYAPTGKLMIRGTNEQNERSYPY